MQIVKSINEMRIEFIAHLFTYNDFHGELKKKLVSLIYVKIVRVSRILRNIFCIPYNAD